MTEEIETKETVIAKPATNYLVPLAILVGFGLVAGAIFMSGNSGKDTLPIVLKDSQPPKVAPQPAGSTDNVRPVTAEDHVKGNLDASVMIVEYSDYECPFCKRFHDTMNQIMDEQGDSGKVAWVFRHFPLDQLHPVKARAVAVASECASEQGGSEAFWKFTDGYFDVTLTNNRTDIEVVIPQIVKEIGLDESAFLACFESGKYDQHIDDDIANAIETGGRGTPWSVVIAPNGKTFPLNGAQPIEAVRQLIDLAVQEK